MSERLRVSELSDVAAALMAHDDYLICGHISPDGDCLGSQLALMHALRALGKKADCLLAKNEPVDYGLRFLPGIDEMIPASKVNHHADYDFISVDVPNAHRMAQPAESVFEHARFTISVDHHQSEDPMADVSYTDEAAPAAALIVWDLISLLGVDPTLEIATCCYTGLMTDTGRFQYQNTTAYAFEAAAAMSRAGADTAAIAAQAFQNRSMASLMLEQRMLSHLEITADGAFAISYLLKEDFRDTGAVKADAEPLVNVMRSLRGVRAACILREQDQGVRGSLRAKDDTDVAAIARTMGGGGHKAAAGFTHEGPMDQALQAVRGHFAALASSAE